MKRPYIYFIATAFLICAFYAGAQTTNLLGIVNVADAVFGYSLKVNPDGSINVDNGGGGGTVSTTPTPSATHANHNGSISAGGTSQQLAPAASTALIRVVQNPCTASSQGIATAENLFIAIGTDSAGTTNFAELQPCGSATVSLNGVVWTGIISGVAATTGHKYYETDFTP